MERNATVLASDAHLGAVPPENERAFLDFLRAVPELGDELILNGDLFDFWFEYRTVIPRGHFPVLRALADLVDGGIPVRLVGGNHDAWGGAFLRDAVGVHLVDGPLVTLVRGLRTYLAHGDGLGEGDRGYRLLKRAIRSRLGALAFRLLHPDAGARIVRRVSGTGQRHDRGPGAEEERAARLSEHAAALLRENPDLDLVAFGHVHRPELREVEPGRYYLNSGDWIHHFTFGRIRRSGLELCRWRPGDGRPEVLTAVRAEGRAEPGGSALSGGRASRGEPVAGAEEPAPLRESRPEGES